MPISKRARMSPSMGTFRRATQRFRIVSISVLLGACSASPVLMVTEQGVDDVHRPVCVVYSDGRVFLGRSDYGSVHCCAPVGYMSEDAVRVLRRLVGQAGFEERHRTPSHCSRALVVQRRRTLRPVRANEFDIDQLVSRVMASAKGMKPWQLQSIAVALYSEPGKTISLADVGESTAWPEGWPQIPMSGADPAMVRLPGHELEQVRSILDKGPNPLMRSSDGRHALAVFWVELPGNPMSYERR